jgi:hypothetical protein
MMGIGITRRIVVLLRSARVVAKGLPEGVRF